MFGPSEKSEKGVSIYTTDLADAIRKNNVDVDLITWKIWSFLSFLKAIPKLRKYDVIHFQHEFGMFGYTGIIFVPLMIILGLFKKGKIVTTFHTVYRKDEKILSNLKVLSWLKRLIVHPLHYKLIDKFSSAVIVHTEFLKEDLYERTKIDWNKINVIPHGVRENVLKFNKNAAKKELGIKGPLYLFIGYIAPVKGVDILLKYAKHIGKTIAIVGSAPGMIRQNYIKGLYEYIKENKIEKYLHIYIDENFDSRGRLWWVYCSAADLILMPYQKMTTSGIFINAMESRKPVVSSDSKYFHEIAEDYGCVKIVKKDEYYPKVIKASMKQLKKMEAEAKRFAIDNSLNNIAKKHIYLYDSIIKH